MHRIPFFFPRTSPARDVAGKKELKYHFVDVNKMVQLGSKAERGIDDISVPPGSQPSHKFTAVKTPSGNVIKLRIR